MSYSLMNETHRRCTVFDTESVVNLGGGGLVCDMRDVIMITDLTSKKLQKYIVNKICRHLMSDFLVA
jgi:hypothetical protein